MREGGGPAWMGRTIHVPPPAARFIWSEYDPPFFWWEPVEMLRKLLLTGFLLAIINDPERIFQRIFVATLVSLIFMLLAALGRPPAARTPAPPALITTLTYHNRDPNPNPNPNPKRDPNPNPNPNP